jgi:hypothetical protein
VFIVKLRSLTVVVFVVLLHTKKKLLLHCVTYSRNNRLVTIYSRKIYSSIFVELKYHFGFFRLCKEYTTEHWNFFSQCKECASEICGVRKERVRRAHKSNNNSREASSC